MSKIITSNEEVPKTGKSLAGKFTILLETAAMSEEEVNAYCRQKGIYPSNLDTWKQDIVENSDSSTQQLLTKENSRLKIENRELKAELRCKEKALAESAALLLLKKKARIIRNVLLFVFFHRYL